jgi:hypothetical protein
MSKKKTGKASETSGSTPRFGKSTAALTVLSALGPGAAQGDILKQLNAVMPLCNTPSDDEAMKRLCQAVKGVRLEILEVKPTLIRETPSGKETTIATTVGETSFDGVQQAWLVIERFLTDNRQLLIDKRVVKYTDLATTEIVQAIKGIHGFVPLRDAIVDVHAPRDISLNLYESDNYREAAKNFKANCYRVAEVELNEIAAALLEAKVPRSNQVFDEIQTAIELCRTGYEEFEVVEDPY